jgi:hypothetical protein
LLRIHALRSVAVALLAAVAAVAAAPPARPPATPEALITITGPGPFGGECIDRAERDEALLARHQVTLLGDGKARSGAATWRAMTPAGQEGVLWAVAWQTSCERVRPRLVDVQIVDERGGLLRRQLISTSSECHGDRFGGGPDDPWYRC